MAKFTDTINIKIKAGNGGAGSVSFLREKYIAKGGPDGGDGGKGGNVYLEADRRYYNLSHLFKTKLYSAENGQPGRGKKMHGRDGNDIIIKVPPGTQVRDIDEDELICDLIEEDKPHMIIEGGIGGKGNAFFKSSTHQSPMFSQPGILGSEINIELNLKLIADIGLVGLPNAGKSTLLSALTNARPKIGDYPFTTLTPNLGVVQDKSGLVYKIADIPGIIEGAHKGHGLGLSFLQHIERVKIILYVIDACEIDIAYNLSLLKSELQTYNEDLTNKPNYIIISKSDLVTEEEINEKISLLNEDNIIIISSINGNNIDHLLDVLTELMERSRDS